MHECLHAQLCERDGVIRCRRRWRSMHNRHVISRQRCEYDDDAGKKMKGPKRRRLVDTLDLLLAVTFTVASI
mgnify:CR=1 FL=1